jgi:uncharacterized protein (DUF58 family)
MFKKYYLSFFLSNRFFVGISISVLLLMLAYFFPLILGLVKMAVVGLGILTFIDILLLYRWKAGIEAERVLPDRFSNGDDNEVLWRVANQYPYNIKLEIIDELPIQFQTEMPAIAVTCLPTNRRRYVICYAPPSAGNIFLAHSIYLPPAPWV